MLFENGQNLKCLFFVPQMQPGIAHQVERLRVESEVRIVGQNCLKPGNGGAVLARLVIETPDIKMSFGNPGPHLLQLFSGTIVQIVV